MQKLFLITQFYPFDNSEESFILPELIRLKEKFDITVIAAEVDCETAVQSKVPEGVKIVRYANDSARLAWLFYKTVGHKISKICNASKKNGDFNKRYYVKGKTFEYWFRKQKFLKRNEPFTIYSFWFLWWNLGFAENKDKYPKMKLITRAHGFDLYDERHRDGKQPFRKYLDSKMDKIIFISDMGKEYYLEKQANKPLQMEKYVLSYLGQEDYCGNVINKLPNEVFTMVSCSNVIPLKRVELIAEALRDLNNSRHIRWIHFGDGLSMDKLKSEAEKTLSKNNNITIEFRGRVDNEEVIKFYNSETVEVFITTSSTEGLPVSISEAMSFGIPIIATNVGGIKEQVGENGILLSSNPTVNEVADAINRMLLMDFDSLFRMRQISRNTWKKKFWIENNAKAFIEAID